LKNSDIDRIYEKMTSIEKAKLMFRTPIHDREGCDRILNSVPQRPYVMLDKAFSQTLEGMNDVTTYWTIEYWKNLCGVLSSFSQSRRKADQLSSNQLIELDDQNDFFKNKITALFRILDVLSDQHSIDKEKVLEIAQAGDIFESNLTIDDYPQPVQDYYHATYDLMDSMISGNQVKDATHNYFGLGN